jgi:putative membrane protein
MKIKKKHIFLTSIAFFISSFFMLKFQNIDSFSSISSIFIILLALPSYYYLISHLDIQRGLLIIISLSLLPLIIEGIAVWTGFPYGHFEYSTSLGYLVFNLVPPFVSFAYLPILLGSLFVASDITVNRYYFSLLTSFFMVLVDMVIDPAAVSIGFWSYNLGGFYYGVPISNFIGWILTGFIYAMFFYILSGKDSLPLPSEISISLIFILSFWVGYLLVVTLYIPTLIGIFIYFYLIQKTKV